MTTQFEISDRLQFDLKVTLRILIVTDGAINLWDIPAEPANMDNTGFTLREMASALWDALGSEYPYTRFAIDHAIHGTGEFRSRARVEVEPGNGQTRTWTELDGFRFDHPSFRLGSYNQVWFFGFWPGNPRPDGGYDTPPNRVPLSRRELQVISSWMNAGGGVFATGDHGLLGSHLSGDILRVNQMRRWFDRGLSNDVPSLSGYDRIDTVVPVRRVNGQPEVQFNDQSDNTPKPLRLKRFTLWDGLLRVAQPASSSKIAALRWAPHPVLCSPLGPIDILPDHMHEGLVREDDEVELDGRGMAGEKEFPGGSDRPRPEVIAWSTVQGGNVVYDDAGNARILEHRVVPTVSVYDGERVSVGRIVVDSTWHNWLDVNVRGSGGGPQATGLQGRNRELVHCYVRNIAQFLASASQRQAMRDGLFLYVVTHTSGWAELLGDEKYLGQRASNVLGQVAAECTRSGLVFEPWIRDEHVAGAMQMKLGKLALPSKDFVMESVLGPMVEAIFELVPSLPRANGEQDVQREDTMATFERIGARLRTAQRKGVVAMSAEWRESLRNGAAVLDAIDRAVREEACTNQRSHAESALQAED